MRNIYEVLRQKEEDCARVQNEIEALKLVAPLLVEEQPKPVASVEDAPAHVSQSTGTDGPTFSSLGHESRLWKRNK